MSWGFLPLPLYFAAYGLYIICKSSKLYKITDKTIKGRDHDP